MMKKDKSVREVNAGAQRQGAAKTISLYHGHSFILSVMVQTNERYGSES